MNLAQIVYLDSIARTNSISDTAKELYVSQPSISKAIRKLEDELGFEILVRSKKGVTFTEKGKLVLRNANEIVRCMSNIGELAVVDARASERPIVNIGICPLIAEAFSFEILSLANSSDTKLAYTTDSSLNILKSLRTSDLDLGIIMMYSTDYPLFAEEIRKADCQTHLLHKGGICLLVRNGHPLSGVAEPSIDDVTKYPYITSGDPLIAHCTKTFLEKHGYDQEVGIIRDTTLLFRYASANDCVISIPCALVDELSLKPTFKVLDISGLDWSSYWMLVWRKRYASEATMKAVNGDIESIFCKHRFKPDASQLF